MVEPIEEVKTQIRDYEDWMRQVKDPEKGVEDYDFIDQAIHSNDSMQSGFVANIGAYLAVYGSDDSDVDDELLAELDHRLTDRAREEAESPPHVREKTKHRDIVYGNGRREGKGLLDRGFGEHDSGHGFLQNMIDEFEDETDNEEDTIPHKPEPTANGGERMTDGKGEDDGDRDVTDLDLLTVDFSQDAEDVFHDAERRKEQALSEVKDVIPDDHDVRLDRVEGYLDQTTREAKKAMDELEDQRDEVAREAAYMQMIVTDVLVEVAEGYGELYETVDEGIDQLLREHDGVREPELWDTVMPEGVKNRALGHARAILGDDYEPEVPAELMDEDPYPTEEEVEEYLEEGETEAAYFEGLMRAFQDRFTRYRHEG